MGIMSDVFKNSEAYRQKEHMTRSEYLHEYSDITTRFQKEKKTLHIMIPCCMPLVLLSLYLLFTVEVLGGTNLFFALHGYAFLEYFVAAAPGALPLGAILIRLKQIKKKECELLQKLEEKKRLCILYGTYDSEK